MGGWDWDAHDVALVELAPEVSEDLGLGGEVGRHEDVGPVVGPARVPLVVVGRRRRPLLLLRLPRAARVCVSHRESRWVLSGCGFATTARARLRASWSGG
jgi:hypothetical protein